MSSLVPDANAPHWEPLPLERECRAAQDAAHAAIVAMGPLRHNEYTIHRVLRYTDVFVNSMEDQGAQASDPQTLAELAARCDHLIFNMYDVYHRVPSWYQADLYQKLCNVSDKEVAIRCMPDWAIAMCLREIDKTRKRLADPDEELITGDESAEQYQLSLADHFEPMLEDELVLRGHRRGRTEYIQSNAALGIEQWFTKLRPGINPRPFQTLVANFLSLSFNPRNPAVPRPPPRKDRKHGRRNDDNSASSSSNKQQREE